MEFSRPEYWSGLPFPSPGDLPKPGIKPRFLALKKELQADSLPALWLRTLEFCWLLAESLTGPSGLQQCPAMEPSISIGSS